MKKILFIIMTTIALIVQGQVGIGKVVLSNDSVILEFADGIANEGGIILPIVSDLPPANATLNGTVLMDRNDTIVKWCSDGVWQNLTGSYPDNNDPNIIYDGDLSGVTENTSAQVGGGVLIGAMDSTSLGVLELRADNKAMVLPKVANPHLNVKSPRAGMMVYDTTSHSLAIFDGRKWSYWN